MLRDTECLFRTVDIIYLKIVRFDKVVQKRLQGAYGKAGHIGFKTREFTGCSDKPE